MRGSFAPPPHGALVLSLWQGCRGEEHSTVRGIDFVGTWAMKERWGTRSNISSSDSDSDSNSNSRTTKPKSTMEQSLSSSSVAPPSDEWRRFGEARRRELVEKDELAGGTSFHLNKNCRIQRYFLLADRILVQFRQMSESPDTEATYVMGNRLVIFLSSALPKHPEYRVQAVSVPRQKSFKDLLWIQHQMQALALKIDEDFLNCYIMNDFDPLAEDDDDSTTTDDSFSDLAAKNSQQPWESFEGGWSYDLSSGDEAPVATDTDVSTDTTIPPTSKRRSRDGRRDFIPRRVHLQRESDSEDEEEEYSPDPEIDFVKDDDDEEKEPVLRYAIVDSMASSILDKIADEDVCFETDSEAVDSWAQDGDSSALSGASSGTAVTYDPARIAFREIMNRLPRSNAAYSRKEGEPPPHPQVLSNTTGESEAIRVTDGEKAHEDWSSFAFASVRRAEQ